MSSALVAADPGSVVVGLAPRASTERLVAVAAGLALRGGGGLGAWWGRGARRAAARALAAGGPGRVEPGAYAAAGRPRLVVVARPRGVPGPLHLSPEEREVLDDPRAMLAVVPVEPA